MLVGGKKVVLDTNFCLLPVRRKRDVFKELREAGYELVVLPEVFSELEVIASRGSGASKASREAKATLLLLQKKGFQGKGLKTVQVSGGYADRAILAYCLREGAAAATHDNELRARLRRQGNAVVTLGRSGALHTEER